MSTMHEGALLCTKCDNALGKSGTTGVPLSAAQPLKTACVATTPCCLSTNRLQPFLPTLSHQKNPKKNKQKTDDFKYIIA